MAEPSKERIAAALALAEAVDSAAIACDAPEGTPPDLFQRTWLARCEALAAYRATAPKLRTRAEVDAEIVYRFRSAYASGSLVGSLVEIGKLCREETAPEPAPSKECDWCQDSSRPPLHRSRTPERIEWVCRRCLEERGKAPNRVTDHDADTREPCVDYWNTGEKPLEDPEPCSCEEAEALRDRIAKTKLFVQQSPKIGWALAAEILRVLNGEA